MINCSTSLSSAMLLSLSPTIIIDVIDSQNVDICFWATFPATLK
jgi:hypothetical protein